MKLILVPTSKDLFFTKNDTQDPRLGDLVKTSTPDGLKKNKVKSHYAILSYPDDDGVARNGGRVGAALAPHHIKKVFYKMTPPDNSKVIFDLGDVAFKGDVEDRHVQAQAATIQCFQKNYNVITLGGGHDYAYPDLSAFCLWAKSIKKTPFIINFDAHLDVRPPNPMRNSGTAFYQILEEHKNINFFEVGIQSWCNSQHHLKWAIKKRVDVVSLDQILNNKQDLFSLLNTLILKKFNAKKHVLALSIDIDAFSSFSAPGASQVFPVGLSANEFLPAFNRIVKKYKPPFLGIYEVNPQFDTDQRTAKLAAILMHQFIY